MTTHEERLGRLDAKLVTADPSAIEPASEQELDAEGGDPVLQKDPPRWVGSSMAGKHLSATSAPFLKAYISFKQWQMEMDVKDNRMTSGGRPRANFHKRDIALAMGWLKRLEAGWKRPPAPVMFEDDGLPSGDPDFGGF